MRILTSDFIAFPSDEIRTSTTSQNRNEQNTVPVERLTIVIAILLLLFRVDTDFLYRMAGIW